MIGFVSRLFEYRSAVMEYTEIARQMSMDVAGNIDVQTAPPARTPENTSIPVLIASTIKPVITPDVYYSQQMRSLKAQNKDTVGYIEIEGTEIQYPVVRGMDNFYYENHTFLKKRNASGAIFMDSKNTADLSDFNLVLYGHNMKDGSMFHELLQYRKTAYTRKHRNIVLTGLHEKKTFYVFSAYSCSRNTDVRGFQHMTKEEKQTFLNVIANRSVISAGTADLTADSQIITLVTCRENSDKDYFVVHGIQKNSGT